jgi:DNA-binding CsgD family transcriptional regulator
MLQTQNDNIKLHFSILDKNCRIIWSSKEIAEKRLIGKFCYSIYQNRKNPCYKCLIKNIFYESETYYKKKWVDMPPCSKKYVSMRAHPIYDKDVKIIYVIKIGLYFSENTPIPQKQENYIKALQQILPPKEFPSFHKNNLILSRRQHEVLYLISEGYSNNDISKILSISTHTVKTHVINIFNKLNVYNRTHAAVLATRHNII